MKPLLLIVALSMVCLSSWSQTDSDTLKVAAPDSVVALVLPDSLWWVALDSALFRLMPAQELYITSIPSLDPVGLYLNIPSCKELEARKGNWLLVTSYWLQVVGGWWLVSLNNISF